MASKLRKFCRKQGCNQLVESGYCEAHKPEAHNYDKYRESPSKRGYGRRWQRARAAWLREHPLCVDCEGEGLVVSATDVDHIIPHRGDMELFWDRTNWQSLCKSCHSRKTMRGE